MTILLVTRERLARADFDGARLSACRAVPRPGEEEGGIASLVERAAGLGGSLGRNVWVLSDEVMSQTLTLAASSVSDLKSAELAKALGFEVQALWGGSADALLDWREAPTQGPQRDYWVVQLPQAERDQIDEAVRRRGGRLSGILHPGGLSEPLHPAESWKRVEFWRECVSIVESGAGVRFIRTDPDRWAAEGQERGATEYLLDVPVGSLGEEGSRIARLDEETSMAAWLGAWGGRLSKKQPGLPLIRPMVRPVSTATKLAVLSMGLVVVLTLCAAHYSWFGGRAGSVAAELADAQGELRRFRQLQEECRTLEKQWSELNAPTRREASVGADVSKDWAARVLSSVSTCCPQGLMLESLEAEPARARLKGVCARPELADRFASKLASDGWVVEPALKRERPRARLYEFEINLSGISER